MKETKIYVGLNDAVTKKQLFDTEKYIKILKGVCFAYHTPFSFDVIEGGYIHENGDYTKETTLELTLIGQRKIQSTRLQNTSVPSTIRNRY